MKGLLRSKLVLTLAAFLMIAAAIAIPLSGSITRSHAQGPTSTSFGPVQITDTDCTVTTKTIATFNKGDGVSGTVDYTNTSGESEDINETLLLAETNGPFSLTITVNTGSHSFNFTAAANNDSLTGCVQNIDSPGEADQTATISGTITTPVPVPTPPTPKPTPKPKPKQPEVSPRTPCVSEFTGKPISCNSDEAIIMFPDGIPPVIHKTEPTCEGAKLGFVEPQDCLTDEQTADLFECIAKIPVGAYEAAETGNLQELQDGLQSCLMFVLDLNPNNGGPLRVQ